MACNTAFDLEAHRGGLLPIFISSCGFSFIRTRAPITFFVASNSESGLAMPEPSSQQVDLKWNYGDSALNVLAKLSALSP